jgi:hypothetical protein
MKIKLNILPFFLLSLFIIGFISSCDNPFAPRFKSVSGGSGMLSNQETIDGVFENFRYAYIFQDTLVYGDLLDPEFVFIYRNYEKGTDESWGREQEMLTSYRLFQATQSLELVWNEILINIGDSLVRDVSRSFNLNIVFNPSDIVRINGIANLRIKKNPLDKKWRIISWRDESNF